MIIGNRMQSVIWVHSVGAESGHGGTVDTWFSLTFLAASSRTNCDLYIEPSVKIYCGGLGQWLNQESKLLSSDAQHPYKNGSYCCSACLESQFWGGRNQQFPGASLIGWIVKFTYCLKK